MSRHGGLSPHCRPLIAAQSQRGLLSVPTGTEFHFHPEVRVPQQPSPSAAASRPATSATKESSVVTGSARPGPLIRPPPGRWPVSTSTTPTLRIRTEVLQTDGPKSLPGRRRFLGRTGKHSHNWPSSYSSPRVRVPLANTICGRICAGGSGRGFQGTWQVGFESEAACFEPLLASRTCRWRAHGGLVIKRARVGAHLSPRGLGWSLTKFRLRAARTGGKDRQPAVWQRRLRVPPGAGAAVPACP